MVKEKLKEILKLHKQWLEDPSKGNRANLSNVDLRNADLSNTDLSKANLYNADLRFVNLRHAYLSNADLRNADLSHANLYNTDLSNANLTNAILPDDIPLIKDIKKKIPKENLDMDHWHSECGTTHCLAGWACALAGDSVLEEKYGTQALGALIFQKSVGEIPNFYSSNKEALEWLDAK